MSKRYGITAEVTISLYAEIEANSKKEALEKARNLPLPNIHDTSRSGCDEDDPYEEWATSGELDGEPQNLRINE